jgi:hypothetical protein
VIKRRSDDVEVARAPIDGGADIEATGASIGGGAPLDDAARQQFTDAFWQACHGGERRMAEYLLALGADLNGTPSWGDSRPLDAADGIDTGREALVNWLRDQGPRSPAKPPREPAPVPESCLVLEFCEAGPYLVS